MLCLYVFVFGTLAKHLLHDPHTRGFIVSEDTNKKSLLLISFWASLRYTGHNRYCLFLFDFIPFAAILDTLINDQQPPSWIPP